MHLVGRELPATTLVVAIDCGKAQNRAMLASGERGVIAEPLTLPTLRDGVDELCRLIAERALEGVGSCRDQAEPAQIERHLRGHREGTVASSLTRSSVYAVPAVAMARSPLLVKSSTALTVVDQFVSLDSASTSMPAGTSPAMRLASPPTYLTAPAGGAGAGEVELAVLEQRRVAGVGVDLPAARLDGTSEDASAAKPPAAASRVRIGERFRALSA